MRVICGVAGALLIFYILAHWFTAGVDEITHPEPVPSSYVEYTP